MFTHLLLVKYIFVVFEYWHSVLAAVVSICVHFGSLQGCLSACTLFLETKTEDIPPPPLQLSIVDLVYMRRCLKQIKVLSSLIITIGSYGCFSYHGCTKVVPYFSVYNLLLFPPWKAWWRGLYYNECELYFGEVRNCKRIFFL